MTLAKNEKIDVNFESLTHEGLGVAKVDGFPIFVPYGLPGEDATIVITKLKKNYGFGRILEWHTTSEHRTEPVCAIYKQCGGCQMQHMTYEGQLLAKKEQVENVLKRIGHLNDVLVHPVLGMDEPWSYRNKAQVPVGKVDGDVAVGFYQQRTHALVPMERCYIQSESNDEIVQFIKNQLSKLKIQPYDEGHHRGDVRHVMVREAKNTGEIMVVLITRTDELPNRAKLVNAITETFPMVKSVVQNINGKRTNVIFGDVTKVLWGEEYIYDTIGDIRFAISARSFYQVNPIQTKVLYDKALEYAGLTGKETVIDAYCGVGTISLFLAQKAKKVYGVEIVEAAIEDARRNAELNGMDNVAFEVGKAEEVIPAWKKAGITPSVIVVDPPRKGCDQALLDTIIEMKPERVVYVSCDPATLARDLRILEDGGFKTVAVQPVDMFPQTNHIENVAKLELK